MQQSKQPDQLSFLLLWRWLWLCAVTMLGINAGDTHAKVRSAALDISNYIS
jgi:hypothetical protein